MIPSIIFAAAATTGFLARLGILISLHFQKTNYNPIYHAVSDYAVGKTKKIASAASIVNSIGFVFLFLALITFPISFEHKTGITILSAIAAVTAIIVMFLPTDLEGQKKSITGILHYVVAIANFTLAYEIINNATGHLDSTLNPALQLLSTCATIGIIAVVASLVLPPLRKVFGLVERFYLGVVSLWLILFSLELIITK